MARFRILIADDDDDDFDVLCEAFKVHGPDLEFQHVRNGVELLSSLKECDEGQYPSVIILDINMPKMDGIEALSQLRQIQAYRRIPVLVYTTAVNPHFKHEVLRLGADGFTIKFNFLREINVFAGDIIKYLEANSITSKNEDFKPGLFMAIAENLN